MNKEYTALVLGAVVKADAGTIRATIGRNRKGRMSVKTRRLKPSRISRSCAAAKKTTLLKITTETGRMHQIRVHMKHTGPPHCRRYALRAA